MTERMSFRDEKVNLPQVGAQFEISLEIPDGFRHTARTTPNLAYPIELAVLANWDLPATEPADVEPKHPASFPRIDLIGPDGVVLWVLRGDVALDYEVVPQMGDWFSPQSYRYLAPPVVFESPGELESMKGLQASPTSFGDDDLMGSWWPSVRMWGRLIPLTENTGKIASRPPYLIAYGFAGNGKPPLGALNDAVTSLTPTYFA